MSKLRKLLENPPQKEIPCRRCKGKRYINPRGMISSDQCPSCKTGFTNSGKQYVTDYDELELQVSKKKGGLIWKMLKMLK